MMSRWMGCTAAALALACGSEAPAAPDAEAVTTTLDSTAIAALPEFRLDTLGVVCAADGYDHCPLESAWANTLSNGRLAIWEPRRPPMILDQTGAVTVLGTVDSAPRITSLTTKGQAFQAVIVDEGWTLVRLDQQGRITQRTPLDVPMPYGAVGFVGTLPVRQDFVDLRAPEGGALRLTRLRDITDTTGTTLLTARVSWLRETDAGLRPAPLFTTMPIYAMGTDGSLAWTPAASFDVEFRDAAGRVRWRVLGPDGPAITPEQLDRREARAREQLAATPLEEEDYAAMRTSAPATHPAITGLVLRADGAVYVRGTEVPQADSVAWTRIGPDGVPNGRFRLAAYTRVLHAAGDSLLVHTPTEGEPWQVRWFGVRAAP